VKRIVQILVIGLLANLQAMANSFIAPTDDTLIKFVEERTNAVRITQTPYRMSDASATWCRIPPVYLEEQRLHLTNPHLRNFVHVYVSPIGESAMYDTNLAIFPVGTIVLKEKFEATNLPPVIFAGVSTNTDWHTTLFTGMLKHEVGYNPECGDWEFFTVSADASTTTSRGKLQQCMDCHVDYKKSDYVTKDYIYAHYALFTTTVTNKTYLTNGSFKIQH
jgi:Cytochrome P460